jgi:hypothetical protein
VVAEQQSKGGSVSVGIDRMQRNFEPMRKQVEAGSGVN